MQLSGYTHCFCISTLAHYLLAHYSRHIVKNILHIFVFLKFIE
jgi:hypothetical protein